MPFKKENVMKLKLTIQKKFTLNTQNYSSIAPSLIIEVVDGSDAEKIIEAHEKLEILADGLFHKQIESDLKTMAVIKQLGFDKYFKNINRDDMDGDIKDAVVDLMNME
jgi:hypothetical protein